jgi:predicted nucleic acid-binding protein
MPTLIDTNILLRAIQPAHPMHAVAVAAPQRLMAQEERLVITVQNVAEFWNAATRPEKYNGLGLTTSEARTELARLEGYFQILTENQETYMVWKTLLFQRGISGVQVHDARLVAVMKVHGIGRILTFNTADFSRFPEIEALHPNNLVS